MHVNLSLKMYFISPLFLWKYRNTSASAWRLAHSHNWYFGRLQVVNWISSLLQQGEAELLMTSAFMQLAKLWQKYLSNLNHRQFTVSTQSLYLEEIQKHFSFLTFLHIQSIYGPFSAFIYLAGWETHPMNPYLPQFDTWNSYMSELDSQTLTRIITFRWLMQLDKQFLVKCQGCSFLMCLPEH